MDNKSVIDIIDLEIGFSTKPSKELFYPLINMSSKQGDFIALVGRNGVGKSTFLRTLARIQHQLSGSVRISGKPINEFERTDFAKKVSFIPAEPIHAANMTVYEFVTLARYPYNGWFGGLNSYDKEIVHSAINRVNLVSFINREIDSLSDGERQRAMIAFAIAQDSDIVLMDEPTAFIDLPSKFEIVSLLKDLALNGKTVIFSTHDLHTAIRDVDTIWLMLNDGFKVGSPEDLALNGSLNRLFERTDIYLDLKTGGFLSRKLATKAIGLTIENEEYYIWTKHALERLGYSVKPKVDDNLPKILCNNLSGLWTWEYIISEKSINFSSLSELGNYLKEINR